MFVPPEGLPSPTAAPRHRGRCPLAVSTASRLCSVVESVPRTDPCESMRGLSSHGLRSPPRSSGAARSTAMRHQRPPCAPFLRRRHEASARLRSAPERVGLALPCGRERMPRSARGGAGTRRSRRKHLDRSATSRSSRRLGRGPRLLVETRSHGRFPVRSEHPSRGSRSPATDASYETRHRPPVGAPGVCPEPKFARSVSSAAGESPLVAAGDVCLADLHGVLDVKERPRASPRSVTEIGRAHV